MRETIISVTGLGYVGLPAATAFATRYKVVAYDHNPRRVEMLMRGEDPSGEVSPTLLGNENIEYTSDEGELKKANFHVVVVPTPVNDMRKPDIALLKKAMVSVGKALKRGDMVVVESTVYPGCVEEELMPILERESGLKVDRDFELGYSPERINPGDGRHTFTTVKKIVSARTERGLERVAETYGSVIEAGVYRSASIKVAEAAKMIENTQRDVNIALMNEVSLIFSRMGIDTNEVLEAASTKWNFLPFHPGLVGGHCIGVDPYYLEYKANQLGYHTQVIDRGRFVNDSMGLYVAQQTVKRILKNSRDMGGVRVMVMGLTYKENVADVRNTRTIDIVEELRSFEIKDIDVVDPVASKRDSEALYGFVPLDEPRGVYDAIIVAVTHREFLGLTQEFFDAHLIKGGVLTDVYGKFKDITGFNNWRL